MKLVRIYDVVKDETFLVDLPERELTFTALVAVIQERGKDIKDYHSFKSTSLLPVSV